MDIIKKTKISYRVTYLEMNEVPKFDWPKNLKHKLSIFLAEDFPSWYFLFFYKQVGKNYYWLNSKKEVFLSGGRFDNLIKDLGNKRSLNAVGAAINRSIL